MAEKKNQYLSLAVREAASPDGTQKYVWKRLADLYLNHILPVENGTTPAYFESDTKIDIGVVAVVGWSDNSEMADQTNKNVYEIVSFSELSDLDIKDVDAIRNALFSGIGMKGIQRSAWNNGNVTFIVRMHDKARKKDVGLMLTDPKKLVLANTMQNAAGRTFYKIPNTPEDPKKTLMTLPIVELPTTNVIKYQFCETAFTREFFLNDPVKIGTFEMYDSNIFLESLIKRSLTKSRDVVALENGKKLTNRDITTIISIIRESLSDTSEFSELMKFDDKDAAGTIAKDLDTLLSKEGLAEKMLMDDKFSLAIRDALWRNEDVRQQCVDFGKESWLSEKSAEQKEKQKQLNELEKSIGDKTALKKECDKLSESIKKMNSELREKQEQAKRTQNYLAEAVSECRSDIKKMMIANLGVGSSGDLPISVSPEPVICEKLKEPFRAAFASNINLHQNTGNDSAVETQKIADAVCSALAQGKHMTAHGSFAPLLADAISCALEGKMADVVFRCSRYTSAGDIIRAINSCNSRVVLLHGVLGEEYDSFVIAVARLVTGKTIVFSDDAEPNEAPSGVLDGYISKIAIDHEAFKVGEKVTGTDDKWFFAEDGVAEFKTYSGGIKVPNFN